MKKPKRMTAREIFANNLRVYRRIREISQEKLALDAGMSRSYLSGIERKARNVSIDNMGLLADVLGIPLKDLLDPDLFNGLDNR